MAFDVLDLVVHKKYNMTGRDSKVGKRVSYNLYLNIYGQGRKTKRYDYDIALMRLGYPIMDEGTGITVLKVLKSCRPLSPGKQV